MAIWTACGKHAVLCWSQSALKTCWIGKVCNLQIRLTDVRMICVQFYSFTVDTARSVVVMGPRDNSNVWNCRHLSVAQHIWVSTAWTACSSHLYLLRNIMTLRRKWPLKPVQRYFYTTSLATFLAHSLPSKATRSSDHCFSGPAQNHGQQLAPYRWPYVARTGLKWHNFSGPPGRGGGAREDRQEKK